jgi:hypothetical protein
LQKLKQHFDCCFFAGDKAMDIGLLGHSFGRDKSFCKRFYLPLFSYGSAVLRSAFPYAQDLSRSDGEVNDEGPGDSEQADAAVKGHTYRR